MTCFIYKNILDYLYTFYRKVKKQGISWFSPVLHYHFSAPDCPLSTMTVPGEGGKEDLCGDEVPGRRDKWEDGRAVIERDSDPELDTSHGQVSWYDVTWGPVDKGNIFLSTPPLRIFLSVGSLVFWMTSLTVSQDPNQQPDAVNKTLHKEYV